MDYVGWTLWFLSTPTQVAVPLFSIRLLADLLDTSTVGVYVKRVRFKEREAFLAELFPLLLCRGLFEAELKLI